MKTSKALFMYLILSCCAHAQQDTVYRGSFEQRFGIAGTVSGLTGTLVVQLDSHGRRESQTIHSNGPYSFSLTLEMNDNYSLSVTTEPAGQNCGLSQVSGSITGPISDANVQCLDESQLIWNSGNWDERNWN